MDSKKRKQKSRSRHSDEQIEADNKKNRDLKRKSRSRRSDEQMEAEKKKDRDRKRKIYRSKKRNR